MNKLRCANPGSAFIGATMALAVDRGLNALLLNRELNNLDGVGSHEIADFCDLMVIATSSFCSSISSHIWIATDMAKLLYGADEDKINSYINSSDRTLTGRLPLNDEIMQSVSSSYKRELREKIWNKNNLLLNEKNISLRAKQLLEAVIELGFAMAGLRDLFTMCQEIIIKDNDNDEYYALKKRDINFIDTSLVVAERAFNQLKAVLKPIALQLISVAEYKCDNWRDIAEENGWDTMCRTGSLTPETAKKRLAGETELAQGPLLNEALDYLWASAYPKEDHVEP
jgi:hypothetical protein